MPTKHQQPDELEAFCQSCPAPEEVITCLKQLGIRLDFQMDAFLPPVYSLLTQLPAQFHFEGQAVLLILQILDTLWNGSVLHCRCGVGK